MADESTKRGGTDKLGTHDLEDISFISPEVDFRPVPHDDDKDRPTWRVRFDLTSDPSKVFGLDINDEVTLGRGAGTPGLIDLTPFGANDKGVSRRHLALRPTTTALYAVDLDSTNGSLRNGRPLGVQTPQNLTNGDTITLGKLQFQVRIIRRPASTGTLERKADLADALAQVARSITAQLDMSQVLTQVAETAMHVTGAAEAAIWLIDESSGQLFLEAEKGIEDEDVRRLRIPLKEEYPAAKVIKTGEPLRARRKGDEERIKIKTGYLVEALVFVPLKLGGSTFGVLEVAQQEGGESFSSRDERLLTAIADFAAIAIHNARMYEATDKALERRVKELTAVNELSRTVTATLDLEELHQVLNQQVNRHWPLSSVRLWLPIESGKKLEAFPIVRKTDGSLRYPPVVMGEGIVGTAAKTGEVTRVGHLADSGAEKKEDGTLKLKTQARACVPLKLQEEVVGVLELSSRAQEEFDEDDIERLQSFSNPIAIAVGNARLFEETERARAAILATANALEQPLIIIDPEGSLLVTNQAAQSILESSLADLFDALSASMGRTTEVTLNGQTYIMSSEHAPELGTIIVMQDMTYVKQLERDRAAIVQTLSHDLKSPLTSLRGWAQLIEQVSPLNEKGEQYMERVVASADRMLAMINRLLESVTGMQATELNIQPLSFDKLVNQALHDVEGAAMNKDIKLVDNEEGEPFEIMGDHDRLYHLALNLIDNAVKYSPESTKVEVTLTFKDDHVRFTVADEGPGIPDEDLSRVFQQYYRSEQSTGGQPGLGVGLSVVKSVAQAHGGSVVAENRSEGGAKFIVTLPKDSRELEGTRQ